MINRRRAYRGWHLVPVVAVFLASAAPVAAVAQPPTPVAAPAPSPSPPAGQGPQSTPPGGGAVTRWSVAPANASGPDGRTRFSYEGVRPGAVVRDYVSITNLGTAPVTFRVYAADGITLPEGTIGMATADVKPTDVGAWTRLPHASLRVPPRTRVVERFTITVPANATPGDHVGGVIASITEKAAGGQVDRENRFAVATYLRVAGTLTAALGVEAVSTSYDGTANPFGGGGAVIAYTVRNTGNVRLSGAQSVSVTSVFGTEAVTQPATLEELLPGDSVRLTARMAGVLPAGPLKAHVTVTPAQVPGAPQMSGPLAPTAQTVGLWATPWPQIVLLLILVAVCAGLWWWLGWSRRRFNAKLAAAEARGRRQAAGQADDALAGGGALAALFEPAADAAPAQLAPIAAGGNGSRPAGHDETDADRAGEAAPPAAPDPD
ncbi:DUF916 domain-containing protein [Phytohabitans sp. ZYX-F-186]|uniref:DUF916 domain-containing protein n=1 Tax=Phytohabitans maris TaxID=3071409 RepID=A0ABU0ZVS8_9ACTN|nr:DUF916 domain-containing protein [Phytohabitans sp. ZYX-F-186]MDQ7911133.1 DUF916 domain-containing protein [Phytohabitans sp. ZYX-F-186]